MIMTLFSIEPMKYIIVPACHFQNQNTICHTTIARLNKAKEILDKDDVVVVTGDVPYVSQGQTLAELMRDYLLERGFPSERVILLKGGVGTFSEARIVVKELSGREMTVVSSGWYLFQARPIFERRAREFGLTISFVNIRHATGLRTYIIYISLGIVVRFAIFFGFESQLESFLTSLQNSRRKGFTFNGCG